MNKIGDGGGENPLVYGAGKTNASIHTEQPKQNWFGSAAIDDASVRDGSDASAKQPQLTKFNPKNAVVKCSSELTQHLRGPTIGLGDGYASLYGAASRCIPDEKDQITIITDSPRFSRNTKFKVGDTEYEVPNTILEGCTAESGDEKNPIKSIILQVNYDSRNGLIIRYSLLRKDGSPKFTLDGSGNKLDLIEYDQNLRIESYIKRNYQGSTRNGIAHGQGTRSFSNGDIYTGEFSEGKFHGQVVFTYSNGNKYDGEMKEGKRDGPGTFYFKNGIIFSGTYINNKAVSGQITLTSGIVISDMNIINHVYSGEINALEKAQPHFKNFDRNKF